MERIGGQDVLMLGVFDGHGSEGQGVSSCIAQKLPRSLDKSALLKVRGAVQHV
jgi:serine/threonine protein phosphatase PrpC